MAGNGSTDQNNYIQIGKQLVVLKTIYKNPLGKTVPPRSEEDELIILLFLYLKKQKSSNSTILHYLIMQALIPLLWET